MIRYEFTNVQKKMTFQPRTLTDLAKSEQFKKAESSAQDLKTQATSLYGDLVELDQTAADHNPKPGKVLVENR